jgi:hypothetical protein
MGRRLYLMAWLLPVIVASIIRDWVNISAHRLRFVYADKQ